MRTRWGSFSDMRKSDVICPKCKAGYRRIELVTRPGTKGEFRCLLCNHLLELFDGSTEVALRLTVQPEKTRNNGTTRFPTETAKS
jgi:hypothetical protein